MSAVDDDLANSGAKPLRRGMRFPRGAWLIIGVEFWERFSFYGMLAILALFLTGPPARGGFGWSDGRALSFVGLYTGLMYALPAFGGFLADRVVGRRRAVTVGASLMLVGQALLASPAYIPWAMGAWHGVPLLSELRQLHVPLGYLLRPDEVNAAIVSRAALLLPEDAPRWLSSAYFGASLGFYVAIACLVVGNALMKSTMVVLCGDTFAAGDARREAAYAYYYLGITVGSFLSGIVVGAVAEAFGWQCAFATGALGVAIGLSAYCWLAPRWLGEIGAAPVRFASKRASDIVEDHIWRRVVLLGVLALLLCIFSLGWFQMYGTWSLFIDRLVNRTVSGFVLPVPWFASWNSLVVITFAPFLAILWVRFAARGRAVDIVQKYAFALVMISLGHFLMYAAAVIAVNGHPAPLWIALAAFALSAIGEVVAWTSTYDIVYRAAPKGLVSATMGAWYLMTLGLGGYLAGAAGRGVEALGYAATFRILGLFFALVAAGAYLARAPLKSYAARSGVAL